MLGLVCKNDNSSSASISWKWEFLPAERETHPNNYLGRRSTPQKLAILVGARGLINPTIISHTSMLDSSLIPYSWIIISHHAPQP